MLSSRVAPMLATSASALPEGDGWSYEVKWDGYRTLAEKTGNSVRLISRNLKNVTRQYPGVAAAVARLDTESVLLDGEIVALDEQGCPSFQDLHHGPSPGGRIAYYAFDALRIQGRDLMKRPLDERRRVLQDVVAGSSVHFSEPLPGRPRQIERAIRELGLEGVVAKRRDSVYTPGLRSRAWVKVRFSKRQELVVGGYKPGGDGFDSILVGYFARARLLYAGKVRAGFTPKLRADIFKRLRPLEVDTCPFANLPNSGGKRSHWGEGITEEEMGTLHWVRPDLVVEVSFVEWTRDGNLRHAAFVGVRQDKRARAVRRDIQPGEQPRE
jgi:bifunctional non-homologous end joining protein LigD